MSPSEPIGSALSFDEVEWNDFILRSFLDDSL